MCEVANMRERTYRAPVYRNIAQGKGASIHSKPKTTANPPYLPAFFSKKSDRPKAAAAKAAQEKPVNERQVAAENLAGMAAGIFGAHLLEHSLTGLRQERQELNALSEAPAREVAMNTLAQAGAGAGIALALGVAAWAMYKLVGLLDKVRAREAKTA